MKVKPDPRLGAALRSVLPDGAERPGAKARIRAAIHARTEESRLCRHTCGYFAAAAVAALVVTAMVYVQRSAAPSEVALGSSRVVGAASAASTLVLSSGAKVLVQPGSDVVVEHDDERETSVRLEQGRVFASVKKRNGKPFVIRCRDVRVEVVGTVFAVESRGPAEVAVGVVAGKVRVSNADTAFIVAAGESWPVAAARLTATAEELAWAGPESAKAEAVPHPDEPLENEAPGPSEAVPSSSQSPSVASSAAMPSVGPRPVSPRPGRNTQGVLGANPPASAPRHEQPREANVLFADAKQREANGDWKGALDVYETVAASRGRDAEDALFAVARLRTKLGDADGALRAFHMYRERYPVGVYARIVDVHVLDLVSKKGDDRAVLREAEAFLDVYPRDPGAWRFHMARAAVAIKNGDCASALRDLASVPDDEASQLRARCTVVGPTGAAK